MSSAAGGGAATGPVQRLIARLALVEPRETATVVTAFILFFFVLGSYFAVRPVRETVATSLGGAKVADLWLFTAGFSLLIVPLYGWLVTRIRRAILLPAIYGVVAAVLAAFATLLVVHQSAAAYGAAFYVWISVINLMLVSVFWSFLLEIFSREQTKRLFGFIAAGGTAGALVGPLATRLLVDSIGVPGVLYMSAAGFVGAILCQRTLLSVWRRTDGNTSGVSVSERGIGTNPFAGIMIVLRTPYLLGIALFVVCLSFINTFFYFEQLRLVEATISDETRRTEIFANIDIAVQSLTILSQLFLTSRIARFFGVRSLLTIVPIVMVIACLVLSAFNTFIVVALALVARRWGEYAFVRPGREMLWSRFDPETKYKAKNVIDVPVYRAADYLGAQGKEKGLDKLDIGPDVAAILAAVIAAGWALIGWWLGRRHDRDVPAGTKPEAQATR